MCGRRGGVGREEENLQVKTQDHKLPIDGPDPEKQTTSVWPQETWRAKTWAKNEFKFLCEHGWFLQR